MDYCIKIQYFGTMRLILKKKEELIGFQEPITLSRLIKEIEIRYGDGFKNKFYNQIFYIYYPQQERCRQLRLPHDENTVLENGSLLKLLNLITGG